MPLLAHSTAAPILKPSDTYVLDFKHNMLDEYAQQTYHWKLFITTLDYARTGDVLDPANQIIIAESGISDLTIDNVEMNAIAVPSVEGGTGTQTQIKFEIVEPSGAGLLDKMFYQATALGIGNWMVMPCYLQLEFRGRTAETSAVIDAGTGGLGSLRWVWPVALTNAAAHVSEVGTKYQFNVIPYDELAQSNSYFSILANITLNNLTKFGPAMQDLADKLNADQYEKLLDRYSIPDTYTIVVDPILAIIDLVLPDKNKSTSANSDFLDLDKKTVSFGPGTGIDKIVDAMLGNTAYYQKAMANAPSRAGEPDPLTKEKDHMKKMWRIVTETRPIAFDNMRQTNAVAITIFIVEYDIGVLDVTPAQTGQTPDAKKAANSRAAEYASKKILQKKYNYIFTGLNDQIIQFDLNMNFAFAATMARFSGQYYDSGTQQPGVSKPTNADEVEKKLLEQIRNTLQFVNNSKNSGAASDAEIAKAQKALGKAELNEDVKSRYAAILKYAKPSNRRIRVAAITAAGGIGKLNLADGAQKAEYLAAPVDGKRFISDVNIYHTKSVEAKSNALTNRKGKMRPIAFAEGRNENVMPKAGDTTNDAARARTSTIFATALYSSLDASMQQVKLTIKGDPFWLFPASMNYGVKRIPYKSNMSENEAIDIIKNAHKKVQSKSVNLHGTDNYIVIRFRTPQMFDQDTGVTALANVEMFSGIYRVITIISKFSMGKFSQELTCQLDPVINLSDIELKYLRDQIEENSKAVEERKTPFIYNTTGVQQASTFPNIYGAGRGATGGPTAEEIIKWRGPGSGSSTRPK